MPVSGLHNVFARNLGHVALIARSVDALKSECQGRECGGNDFK